MSELTLTLLRLGFLALLWLLVLSILAVLRRDLFGTRVVRRAPRPAAGPGAGVPAPAQPAAGRRQRAPEAPRGLRTLVVTEGSLRGTTLTLGQAPVLIGRAPECTLVLDDDFASARHARIAPADGGWVVEDLGSTNGTFVGSARLTDPVRLEAGVPVRVGRTVLELRR
ncbi:MAG TPA: FHA domain-containing protein [Kineosporiaceae bacterium]|nr:FHA domain-containing protein [Kineosporiaceae bacterium]